MHWVLIVVFVGGGSSSSNVPMKLSGFPTLAACQRAANQISRTMPMGTNGHKRMACVQVPVGVS